MKRSARLAVLIAILTSFVGPSAPAQTSTAPEPSENRSLDVTVASLAEAMKQEDAVAIRRHVQEGIARLGDRAGLPEVEDVFRPKPRDARPLSEQELSTAFEPYLEHLERIKWWKVGLNPEDSNHALREVASVIEGCLAARSAGAADAERCLATAREAGDFLVWTQEQAGTGVFPFPGVRNGEGRPFEVAEAFYRRAEREGRLADVIRNGWTVDDLGDGGLQFDNGLAGAALVRLYEATRDESYRAAVLRSADWAMSRPIVPNWNYNSFSVRLLAETYRISGDEKYLASAKKKALLGVLPGQLIEGPRRGRWADPHNARPAYHYIMVRGLASLAAALPQHDPDLPQIAESLRLALVARNPEFRRGVFNADSSVEALTSVKTLPGHVSGRLLDCETDEALSTLEAYATDAFRSRKSALAPGAWGALLAYESEKTGRSRESRK